MKKIVKTTCQFFLRQFDILFKKNITPDQINEITEHRYIILRDYKKLTLTKPGYHLLCECTLIAHSLHFFLETYASMKMGNYEY